MMGPPHDEAELIERARMLAGRRVAEVAADLGGRPPEDLRRAKGFVGQLCEAALGAPRSSSPEPDFKNLGVELKTLPLGRDGAPCASTYVCRVDPTDLAKRAWATSRLRHKLARVLFVPFEGHADIAVGDKTFGQPFLWSPDDDEDALLRADWEDFADLAAVGLLDTVSARRGRFLQVRPKGRNRSDRQTAHDAAGEAFRAAPRGFYLRPTFTGAVLSAAFG